MRDWRTIDSIKAMAPHKALITFASMVDMEDALILLGEHFDEIQKWSEDEFCQT